MRPFDSIAFAIPLAALLLAGSAPASATDKPTFGGFPVRAQLVGFQEVPSVFSEGRGRFFAQIKHDSIEYILSYEGLLDVLQAHIHLGQRHTNGGVSVFLCTNLAPPEEPEDVPVPPECPKTAGKVTGVLTAADVVGPAGQGIAPEDPAKFEKLVEAILAGAAYANVHTDAFRGGEIRGQIKTSRRLHR